jgi:hypothetical protein
MRLRRAFDVVQKLLVLGCLVAVASEDGRELQRAMSADEVGRVLRRPFVVDENATDVRSVLNLHTSCTTKIKSQYHQIRVEC